MSRRAAAAAIVAAAASLGVAWAFWEQGGAAATALGLGAFDPLARVALGFLALSAVEAALSRLSKPSNPTDDHP